MAAKTSETGTAQKNSYVYGNAVRKNVQILPDPRKDPIRKLREQEKRERDRTIAQAERISLVYVLFLTAAAVMLVFICYQFLTMQTAMNKNVASISSLQMELEDLKAKNDFQMSQIKESVDLGAVRAAAERLGMVDAAPEQIVEYDYDASDYVRQYKDVPEGDDGSVLEYFSE